MKLIFLGQKGMLYFTVPLEDLLVTTNKMKLPLNHTDQKVMFYFYCTI